MTNPVFHFSPSQSFARPAGLASAVVAAQPRSDRTCPLILIPAFLLAVALGRILGLGLTLDGAGGEPSLLWVQMDAPPATVAEVETVPPIAHGVIAGLVLPETAIYPGASRPLPPTATLMSEDSVPFQLRTADLTTDAAICSHAETEAVGNYRFDFHDGGLSLGEEYSFLTFVTQSYRPVSLCDRRLLLPAPHLRPGANVQYVAR